MAKLSRRLIHSHDSSEDLLFRGNAELAAKRPDRALQLYTKVLYEVCPGHVCAFLNRSLAYISLGYPELAVMDAYRAALVCNKTRYSVSPPPQTVGLCAAVARYLRAEKLHLASGEPWTSRSESQIGPGWLSEDFARIVLSPVVYPKQKPHKEIPWDQLEIRAVYRMCGALWQCGLGARADALGLVEDMALASSNRIYQLEAPELKSFLNLGDEILEDCVADISRDNELTQGLMKSKFTWAHRVVYPWNTHARDTATSFTDAQDLEIYADCAAPACTVRSKVATSESGAALTLIAARDIYCDEAVLSEEGLLQVSTADSVETESFFCDACAAIMITSEEAQPQTGRQQSWASSRASVGSTIPNSPATYAAIFEQQATEQDHSTNVENSFCFAQAKEEFPPYSPVIFPPDTPPSRPPPSYALDKQDTQSKLDLTPDFHHCNVCLAATFCCGDCFGFSSDYHLKLCNTGVEARIRSNYRQQAPRFDIDSYSPEDSRPIVRPENRCLYDLLFVRIMAMAVDQNVNVLDLPEIRWLNGNLRTAPSLKVDPLITNNGDQSLVPEEASSELTGQRRSLPWTFTNNVLLPISYLKSMDIDPITHLDKTDGWVINTLYAKIMHCTRITKGVRLSKTYDDIGKLIREEMLVPQPTSHEMWVGSIHPIFSMIGVVASDEVEAANVVMREGRSVKCFATSNRKQSLQTEESLETDADDNMHLDNPTKPCIKAGDRILRLQETKPSSTASTSHGDDSLTSWIGDVKEMSLDLGREEPDLHDETDEQDGGRLGDCEMDTTG